MSDSFFKAPPSTRWNVLNLGAGVQSSTLALMAAHGEVGPMPDFAVFADTQAEPTNVYQWLDWLETKIPFPVYRVTAGNLTEDNLKLHKTKKGRNYHKRLIPMHGLMPNGDKTFALGRKCTNDYKIVPIVNHIKNACEIKRAQKEVTVTQWIGISYDEMQRMKLPQKKWTQHRWPLVELKMRRRDCIAWMKKNNYPEPPRSACYYCPFHDDTEWRRLRDEDPVHFQKAIEFDETIRREYKKSEGLLMEVYIHSSCKPLSKVDFDSPEDKGQLNFDFKSECEGMCGL